jgi:hypothetical protein
MLTVPPLPPLSDPSALLAIARAARLIGDRELERAARRLLRDRYGIDISFRRGAGQEIEVPSRAS